LVNFHFGLLEFAGSYIKYGCHITSQAHHFLVKESVWTVGQDTNEAILFFNMLFLFSLNSDKACSVYKAFLKEEKEFQEQSKNLFSSSIKRTTSPLFKSRQ